MNKLYLLLPIAKDSKDGILKLLLKEVDFKNGQEAFDYMRKIYDLINTIGYEDYEGVYDESQLNPIMEKIRNDKEFNSDSPSPELIILAFKNWSDYHDDSYTKITYHEKKELKEYLKGHKDAEMEEVDYDEKHIFLLYGNKDVKDTIFNAYMQNMDSDAVAMLNNDACQYNEEEFKQHIDGEKVIPVKLLPVDFDALHKWFSENRKPQRQFDDKYEKHGEKTKLGKRGCISPLTYTKDEIKPFLHRAIGAREGKDRNLFFYDRDKNVYLYFWDENTPNQLFHAYEVKPENKAEINKILSKGGRQLLELIDKLGNEEEND